MAEKESPQALFQGCGSPVSDVDRRILESLLDGEGPRSAEDVRACVDEHVEWAKPCDSSLGDRATKLLGEWAKLGDIGLGDRATRLLEECRGSCVQAARTAEAGDIGAWTMATWLSHLTSAEGANLADIVSGPLSEGLDAQAQLKFVRALGEANDVALVSYFCVTSGLLDALAHFLLQGAREMFKPPAPCHTSSELQAGATRTSRSDSGSMTPAHLTAEDLKQQGLSPAEAKELLGDDSRGSAAKALLALGLREKCVAPGEDTAGCWEVGEEVLVRYDDGSAGFYRIKAVSRNTVRTDYAMEFDAMTGEGLYDGGRKLRKAFALEWA